MSYVRSVLAGVAAAFLAIVIFTAALIGFVNFGLEPPPYGGLVAIPITLYQVVLAAAIGFAIGFWWNVRGQRRRIRG